MAWPKLLHLEWEWNKKSWLICIQPGPQLEYTAQLWDCTLQPSKPTIGPHLKPKNNENEEWICLFLYRSATLFYGNLRFHPTLGTFENFDRERERGERSLKVQNLTSKFPINPKPQFYFNSPPSPSKPKTHLNSNPKPPPKSLNLGFLFLLRWSKSYGFWLPLAIFASGSVCFSLSLLSLNCFSFKVIIFWYYIAFMYWI
jgi:hypothetical protein